MLISHFDTIPARDGHGRTDGQTDIIVLSISRVSTLTRDKNKRYATYALT